MPMRRSQVFAQYLTMLKMALCEDAVLRRLFGGREAEMQQPAAVLKKEETDNETDD